ncbi:MAG TPA: hypothetical protein PK528_00665 [Syntrophorhabdus sp.]|nr:hypothetical protein [Syntrophorhabdus sp.]
MSQIITLDDAFGFLRPAIDAHTLGLTSVSRLLSECGIRSVVADSLVCEAANHPQRNENIVIIEKWIHKNKITRLGFSYRLDPYDGAGIFGRLLHHLRQRRLLHYQGGPIRSIFFAGLPRACDLVKREHKEEVILFQGDESSSETLDKLGIPDALRPLEIKEHIAYDAMLLDFGKELIASEKHMQIKRMDRSGYPGFGSKKDLLVHRIHDSRKKKTLPLFRAHVGPYLPDRVEAVHLLLDWCRQLAHEGLLDILSIGTSQLSQSHFGEDWEDKPNGGGVPINSPIEFSAVWDASRPMLVRTYAGTTRMPELARIYESYLNMAWHALSLWWFCKIDGRGPLPVLENLNMQLETLRFIAGTDKPYEPNISHHFSFRGADDVTYLVTAVLAAKLAKRLGIRFLIMQNMLNTPKSTWGIQDLAKSRALLMLVRELEDKSFNVFFQPRAGLDYFSHEEEKARVQLAAVTAMMDDIEPHDPSSPEIIHVVSYSEGSHLADPHVINDSIRITRAALDLYREKRKKGHVPDISRDDEIDHRMEVLLRDARIVVSTLENTIQDLYTAHGLYKALTAGFFPLPYLWGCREELRCATQWRTNIVNGGIMVVDDEDRPIPVIERMGKVIQSLGCHE